MPRIWACTPRKGTHREVKTSKTAIDMPLPMSATSAVSQQTRANDWKNLHDLHTRDIDHLVQELQLWNHHGRQNHWDEPLRNDRDKNDDLAK